MKEIIKCLLCIYLFSGLLNQKIFAGENKDMKTWETNSDYKIIQVLKGRINVFLLSNGVQNILIDTGPKNKRNELEKQLDILKISHIDYLILTHTHFDHAGNAAFIKNKYKAKVIVHSSEVDYLQKGYSPLPDGSIFPTKILISLANKLHLKFLYEPCLADIQIKDTLNFSTLGFNAYILHTPGHSIGSMSVIVDNEYAIVGDTMFGVYKSSIFPPFSDNNKQMIESWRLLLDTNCSVFIPAHGSSKNRLLVQNNYEKESNKLRQPTTE